MTSYVVMALLTLIAVLLLLRPWLLGGKAQRLERKQANLIAYRTRVAEIENDLAGGLMDTDSASALKQEMGARLLNDVDESPTAPQVAQRRPYLALLLALIVPVFAVIWYASGDSWQTQHTLDEIVAHPDQAQHLMIEAMVQRLEQRMKKSPDDAEGWAMLGRSYFVTQRYAEASQAYAKANRLNGSQTAEWLVGQGESLAMANDRHVAGEPQKLFKQALTLDPNQGKALWYAGLAAAQSGQFKEAMAHWLKLRDQQLPDELRTALNERLQELSQLGNLPIPARVLPKEATPVSLQVHVSLSPGLLGKVPAGASLLVFAKAAGGPPMPLAVQKLDAGKLPMTVTLDDSMAMMPSMKLSQFQRWVLTARVSQSGSAQAQPGDLQGSLELDRAAAVKPVTLVISEVVP